MSRLSIQEKQGFDMRFAAIRSIDPETLVSTNEQWKHSIKDVRVGGCVIFNEQTHIVESIGRYDEFDENFKKKTGFSSFELKLFCLETGKHCDIEWEEDDEVEISVTTTVLSFSDLRDDEGDSIDDDDLDQICSDKDSVVYNNTVFNYDDDWPARYYRNGGSRDGLKVFFYDFESKGGTCLSIEEWVTGSGENASYEYELFLSEPVNPASIGVMSLGPKSDV